MTSCKLFFLLFIFLLLKWKMQNIPTFTNSEPKCLDSNKDFVVNISAWNKANLVLVLVCRADFQCVFGQCSK